MTEPQYSSLERELQTSGVYVSTTVGTSMSPMLRNRRDRIILRRVEAHPLKKWALPIYRRPDGKYVLHRIIAVREDHYVIRGDNTFVKEKVPFDWVLGYVTEFYRGERRISSDARGYRLYAALWQTVAYPVRAFFHGLHMAASRLKRALLRKKQG